MPRRNYDRDYDTTHNQNTGDRYGRGTNYGRGDYGGEGRYENDYGSRGYNRGYNRGNYGGYENESSYSGGYPSDFGSNSVGSYFGGSMRYGDGYSGGSERGSSYNSDNTGSYGGSSDYDRDNENYNRGDYGRSGSYGQQGSYSGQGYDRDYDRQNWGSARSDYGDYAYGGDLNNQGMESHRGKGPKNYTRSDDRIKEDVNDRLSDSHQLDASNIEVSVSDGEITLSGTVDSRSAKRRAEDIADSVSGVKHTQNNLRVSQSSSQIGSSNQSTISGTTASSSAASEKTGNNKSKSASS